MEIKFLLLMMCVFIHTRTIIVQGIKPPTINKKWQTLNGDTPKVIARGGLSGVFPESSVYATDFVKEIPDLIMLCNVQMTKDKEGICQPEVILDNTTNIDMVYPKASKTYKVNGKEVNGWFSIDYTLDELTSNVTLMQNIFRRPSSFDETKPVSTVDDIIDLKMTSWLNVQYDMFYTEHKIDIAAYLQKFRTVKYISSPEIGFLKRIAGKINSKRTKLIFVFLNKEAVEPSTKETYEKILEDLDAIKSFASGIAVPKSYIWPVQKNNYLESNPTTLVTDAHTAGLEVYATGFANDFNKIYNYSYDPVLEYLNFVNNSDFTVDGVISDYPNTASSAVGCFSQYSDFILPRKESAVTIITHNGASGVYAGCTDLAYEQALKDGADIIDCSVQMSKDGTAFCMDSADLTGDTNAMANFMSQSTTITDIKATAGIFSFSFTWDEIKTLQPRLASPFTNDNLLPRNPAYKSAGKFLKLSEFLEFAKDKAPSGILINIENAAYLASKQGLDIVKAVSSALSDAGFDDQQTQAVLIQSDDTSVLSKFMNVKTYTRVLYLKEEVSDAPKKSVQEIKKFADAVNVPRFSVIPTDGQFAQYTTPLIDEMHASNLTVFISVLRNEFLNLAFDYFADPTVELATYNYLGADGIITDFPATTYRFLTNICSNTDYDIDTMIMPIQPPMLRLFVTPQLLTPAPSPKPPLEVADVVDPPLPPVTKPSEDSDSNSPPANAGDKTKSSSSSRRLENFGLLLVSVLSSYFFFFLNH